jgi:small-conductance mechanosensitive channel/CRP-like cAMP-binding protein
MAFFDKIEHAVDPILPGLVVAAIFIVLILGLRIFYRQRSVTDRLKGPINFFYAYVVVFAFAVLAKVYWRPFYRALYLLSLFILALAVILALSVAVFDFFLGRYRKVHVPAIFKDIIIIVVYVMVVIILIGQAGVNVTSIITTSAVLTAVIGFALQDLLSNIISGLAIQMERPFRVGHWVQFNEQVGKVLEINWRSTKIETLHRDIVIIPNNLVTKTAVINFSIPNRVHRRKLVLGMRYEAPPNRVRSSILKALEGVEGVLERPAPFISVKSYDDFSIGYKIFFFIDDFQNKERIESQVHTRLWYQLKRDGLSIPFPIQDINVRTVSADLEEQERKKQQRKVLVALGGVPFLEPLSEKELETLAARLKTEFYARGERIITQGDPGASFYIIASGSVDVQVKKSSSAAATTVATLRPYDYFGERSLMTGEKRSATVIANEDAELYVIDKAIFKNIISANENLIEAIGKVLAERKEELEETRKEMSEEARKEARAEQNTIISKIRRFFQL